MKENILIITPTFNEKENIEPFINSVMGLDLSLLIVDDNSPDKTYEVVKKLQKKYKNLFLIQRAKKLGLGSAYKEGFDWGIEKKYDYIIEMDADFSHRFEDLTNMISHIDDYDFILGSRYVYGGGSEGWDYKRKMLSLKANQLTKKIIKTNINDLTTGFRIYKVDSLSKLNYSNLISDGYSFQIEMAYLFIKYNFKINEVPIIFLESRLGKSKMSWKIIIEAFKTLLYLYFQRIKNDKKD